MVGKLCHLKQIRGQAAHQIACAVAVVEIKAHRLHMGKQIFADIRLHPDAKGVSEVGNGVFQVGTQHIAQHHRRNDDEKGPVHLFRQYIVQRVSGHQWERQVDGGNGTGAQHIDSKELLMVLEIAEKNH